jgi:hypothetical protein
MTVLRREDARGFDGGRPRKYLIGLVMVVAGIGAAFGISQLINDGNAIEVPTAMAERGAAMQENVETLTRIGQAQMAAQAATQSSPVATLNTQVPAYAQGTTSQSPVATLGGQAPAYAQSAPQALTPQQEAAAVQARTGVAAAPAATEFTLEDELNAIHGVEQPAASTGSTTFANEHNAIFARTGVEQAGATVGGSVWTLEDELSAIHGRLDFEKALGQSETAPYTEPASGPR